MDHKSDTKKILRIVFSAKYARKWLYIFDNDSVMPCEKSVFFAEKGGCIYPSRLAGLKFDFKSEKFVLRTLAGAGNNFSLPRIF